MRIFEKGGPDNTKQTLELAAEIAVRKQIPYIVVASHSGSTAEQLRKIVAAGINVICVTTAIEYGSDRPNRNVLADEKRISLERSGVKIVRASHILSGPERALSQKFGGVGPVEIIAHALRMISVGTKVCVEIAVMALDAGCLPYGEPVIAVGGTKTGADTIVILRPSPASSILDTKIDEIVCKPRA